MGGNYLLVTDLPFGIFEAEIFDLFTDRQPNLVIVWLLNIVSGNYAGSRVEYSYLADKSASLTSDNFKAVGVNFLNLQSVLENPKIILGKPAKVVISEDGIRFESVSSNVVIQASKAVKTPF